MRPDGRDDPGHGMGAWRPMRGADLPDAEAIADLVHVAHPEDEGRMAERLRLFAAGCGVFVRAGAVRGYVVAHPWIAGRPPALNTALGALPAAADTLFLHDLTLAPGERGAGGGAAGVARIVALARMLGMRTVSLVAVGGTGRFWRGQGFRTTAGDDLSLILRTYDAVATYMERPVAS